MWVTDGLKTMILEIDTGFGEGKVLTDLDRGGVSNVVRGELSKTGGARGWDREGIEDNKTFEEPCSGGGSWRQLSD